MAIVYGLAGLRDYGGKISFNPKSPPRTQEVRIPLTVRGQRFEVVINKEKVTYTLKEGDGLTIYHANEEIQLSKEEPTQVKSILAAAPK